MYSYRLDRVLRKYFNIFRVALIERMAYRGDFFLGTILRFFPMITTILFWQAVYAGAGEERSKNSPATHSGDMIAYLLLVHISRMFSSMPGLSPASPATFGRARSKISPATAGHDRLPVVLPSGPQGGVHYHFGRPYAGLFLLCSDYFAGLWPAP